MLLLLAHATERGVLPAKLFDYLGAGGPILSIPDDRGEVTDLLRRTGAGITLNHPEEIAAQLAAWYQAWKMGKPLLAGRNEQEIARYSRREQTRQLAGILDELASP